VLRLHLVERQAELFRDRGAAGEDGDVTEVGLAAVAEARRLDGADVEHALEAVDHERRERFALDVLGDHDQGLARARRGLEDRQEFAHVRDLAVVDEDQRIRELGRQLGEVGREVRREVALVEGHALDDLDLGLEPGVLLDRDHALVADLLERAGEHLADARVVVRGERADVRLLGARLHLARLRADRLDRGRDRLIDPVAQLDRAHSRGDVLQAFVEDRRGEHRRGRRAVAGDVVRLVRDLEHELRAHVLERVLEVDLLRDRDAVLGHGRRAERLLEDDVATRRSQRDTDGLGELLDARAHLRPGVVVEQDLLGHVVLS
jgi:hypothetical protein